MRLVLVGAVVGLVAAAAVRAEDAAAEQAGKAPAGMCRTVVLKPCEPVSAAVQKKAAPKKHRIAKAGTLRHKKASWREQLAAMAPATLPTSLTVGEASPAAATSADSAAPPGGGGVSGKESDTPWRMPRLNFALLQQTLARERWPHQETSLFGGAPRPPEVMQTGFGLLVERRFAP